MLFPTQACGKQHSPPNVIQYEPFSKYPTVCTSVWVLAEARIIAIVAKRWLHHDRLGEEMVVLNSVPAKGGIGARELRSIAVRSDSGSRLKRGNQEEGSRNYE